MKNIFLKSMNSQKFYISMLLMTVFSIAFFVNSCQDTFGTDPLVNKVPVDPKDTTQKDSRMHAKQIYWRFKEIVKANQIKEWPNSITYINNSAMIDTTGGKNIIWLNLEMKADFITKFSDDEKPDSADRVEYLKIKIDSLEFAPNQSFGMDNLQLGRYSRIEIYNQQQKKKFSFEGSDLMNRIRFDISHVEGKITGNFVFDFQKIDYIKTIQFLGNFSIYY